MDATKGKGTTAKRVKASRAKGEPMPIVIGGVSSVPPSFARPDRPYDHTPYGATPGRNGFPPPSPRNSA